MIKKEMLQQENEVLRQRVAKLEKQLVTCMSEKSEERFRSLFEQAPFAYQSLDEQGCFVEVNPAYCKLTGYDDDELRGRSFGELWSPTTRSAFAQAFETLKRENRIEADLQLVRRDGTVLEVVLNGSVQRNEQGQFVRTHCILHNVTERKRMELALKEEQLRFAQIAAAIPGVLTVLRSHPDGRFNLLYASQAFEEVFGLSLTDLNKHADAIILSVHPADIQKILAQLGEMVATLQPIHFEFRYQHPHKGEIWLENRAQPVQEADGSVVWYGVTSDITERKQTEEKLRESEKRFSTIFQINPVGIVLTQLEDGLILNVNDTFLKLFGYQREECIGSTTTKLQVYPEPQDRTRLIARLMEQEHLLNEEVKFRRKSGQIGILLLSAQLIELNGKKNLLSMMIDITERKQAEEKLRASEEQYRFLLDNSSDFIARFDRNGIMLFGTEASVRFIGYRPEEIIHTSAFQRIHPEDHDKVRAELHRTLESGLERQMEYRVRRKSGEYIWVEATGRRVLTMAGEPEVIVVQRDITKRKHAEEALEQVRLTLTEAQKIAHLGSFQYLAIPQATIWSEEEYRIYGLDPEKPSPTYEQMLQTCIHPDDAALLNESFTKALQNCSIYELEHRIVRPDGSVRWVYDRAQPYFDEQGNLVRYVGVTLDITDRKHAEEALRESEEKYRGLMETLDSAVATIDANGKFLYMNEVAARQLNSTPQALIGKTMHELIPEPFASQQVQGVQQVFRDDKGHVTETLSLVQGESRWFHNSLQPIHDDRGQVIAVLLHATDIHALKTAQQELADLNRTLEQRVQQATAEVQDLYDNAPTGYHSLDANGRITMINQTELNWLGYSRTELLGQPFARLFTPASLATFQAIFPTFKQRGWTHDVEVDLIRKDGSTFPVVVSATAIKDEAGNYLMSRTTVFNNTARKQAEEALRESLNRVNALYAISHGAMTATRMPELLEFISDTLVHALPADKVIAIALDVPNRQVECAIRSSAESHENWDISFDELWEGLSGWALRERAIAISQGGAPDERESPVVKKRRKETHAGQIVVIPLIYQDKLLGTLTAINRPDQKPFGPQEIELTQVIANQAASAMEHFHTELALRESNHELARALRVKDEFLANMSHELRTPLNGILGMAEILLDGYRGPLNDRQRNFVNTIDASGRHLLSLINDILDLSKIEADKMELHLEPVVLADICEASLAFIKQPAMKKGVKIAFTMGDTSILLQADGRRLKQILVNLLSNAVKFTPPEGHIALDIHPDPDNHAVTISVRDTGIGISQTDQQHLFSPFTQVDNSLTRSYEGTGLGLALVKRLTELHGGTVSVESTPDQGSRFTLTLPWQAPPPQPEISAPPFNEAILETWHAKSKATLLLVEDNPTNTLAIGDYLDAKGYSLVYAHDGLEALAKAAERAPDLILMDIQMPKMDGLEATRRLRADPQFATTPIIALTAFAMVGDEEKALAAGANGYMSKPVRLRELVNMIEALLPH